MATTKKEPVRTSLSEARMLVLGAQIGLGTQYRASFEPGFPSLPHIARFAQVASLVLLVASTAGMIAPASYYRLVSGARATAGRVSYTEWMALSALVRFAVALGMSLGVVPAGQPGLLAAGCVGAVTAGAALPCGFSILPVAIRRNPS